MGTLGKEGDLNPEPEEKDSILYKEVIQRSGVNIPAQYARFRPVYPKIERGIPRRYLDVTPTENLYDPTRILGQRIQAKLISTGETIYMPPRVEGERMVSITNRNCTPPEAPFQCPPPYTQLPYVKKQVHMEPSRDAEIFHFADFADIPASADGVVPATVTVFSFDTFTAMKYIFKWTNMVVFDALTPSLVTMQINVDGRPVPWVKRTTGTTTGTGGITYLDNVSTPNLQDLQLLPEHFHNSLYEIEERHHVDVIAGNLAQVDRRIRVSLWGWIEQRTVFDEQVQH